MVRPRMELKLIENQRKRNATYRKRIEGLKKKAYELATLCSIPALIICFGPSGQVDTWPDNSREIQEIVTRYKGLSRKARDRHKLNRLGFLKSHIRKQQVELDCKARDDAGKLWDPRLDDLPEEALRELARSLDLKLEAVRERIELLNDQKCLETNADVNGIEEIFREEKITDWQNCQEDGVDRQVQEPVDHYDQNVGFSYPSETMAFAPCLAASGYGEAMGFSGAQVAMDPFLQYSYTAPIAFAPPPIAFGLSPVPPECSFGIYNYCLMGAGGEGQFYTTGQFGLNGVHHPANALGSTVPSSSGTEAVVNSANMPCPIVKKQ